jgi:hypothetical protein
VPQEAPENIFKETEMYAIKVPDGKRDLRIEHGLSELENPFIHIRDAILEERDVSVITTESSGQKPWKWASGCATP